MTAAALSEVESIFAQALGLDPAQRAAEVRRLAKGDDALEREVLDLLAQLEDDEFLDPERFAREQSGLMFEGVLPVAARVGQYTVLGVLGAGGMGTVYLAEQARPRRQVALKVIAGPVAREAMIARFEREADLLGRLSHPGIAQIFEAGVADYGLGPRPFIAMERVEGEPISTHARRRALSARQCADLVARVADAVEHAHLRGVIHRDLKPGNILVTGAGEPKVLDFGVARAVDDEFAGHATATGGVLGTLSYMAPEQLRDSRAVDTRADVYALGVILFELLAGRPPHDCATGALTDILRRVCDEPAPRLGTVDRGLRGEIETIVACALEKDPERRYRSAAELADDLRRWLRDEPIAARRDSLLDGLARTTKRNRRVILLGAGALAAAIVVAAWAVSQAARNARLASDARASRDQAVLALGAAQRERARADAEAARLEERLYSSNIGFSQAALAAGDVSRVRRLLESCPEPMRGWEWRYLAGAADHAEFFVRAHDSGLGYAAVDAARGRVASARLGEDLIVRSLDDGRVLSRHPVEGGGVFRVVFDRPTGGVVVANQRSAILRIDPDTGETVVVRASHSLGCREVRACDGGDVLIVDTAGATERVSVAGVVWRRDDFDAAVMGVDTESGVIALGGYRGGVRTIRATDGELIWSSDEPAGELRAAVVAPGGVGVLAASVQGEVVWFDASGGVRWRTRLEGPRVSAGSLTRDGRYALVACSDGGVVLLDAERGETLGTLRGHASGVTSFGVVDGAEFVSLARDGVLRWWDADRARARWDRAVHVDPRGVAGLASLGESFLAVGYGGLAALVTPAEVRPWEVSAPSIIWRAHADAQGGAVVSTGDGSVVFTRADGAAGESTTVRLSDWRVSKAVFSPGGERVAAVGDRGQLWILDSVSRETLDERMAHASGAIGVVWAHDGASVWTVGNDGALRRWAVDEAGRIAETPELEERVSPHPLWEIVASRDGAFVACAGEDGSIYIYEPASRALRALAGHAGQVFGMALHPSEPRLASVGNDARLRLWDVTNGDEVLQLSGGVAPLIAVAFTASGDTLAAGGSDGVVRVWRAPAED